MSARSSELLLDSAFVPVGVVLSSTPDVDAALVVVSFEETTAVVPSELGR